MSKDEIVINGARSHNLKNISLAIPRGKFVVVTGLSGSGKSTLAFDTIYAEGQRRYMDTLSTYARHFMGIMEKPQVESISGLSPIIAIEQKTTGNNPRSTVGTITEIYDFLRLLYARASTCYSPATGKEMVRYSDEQIVSLITENYRNRKCYLLAPLVVGRKGHYKELFANLRKRGFTQVRIDSKLTDLADVTALDRYKTHFIELVVDKIKPDGNDLKRLRDSITTALNFGRGSLCVMEGDSIRHFSKHLVCADTGISVEEPAPHSFSFNSPHGYCPHCKGLGEVVDVNLDTIIPDRTKSVADGGIVQLGTIRDTKKFEIIHAIARKYGFSLYDPIEELSDEVVSLLVYGSDELFRVGEGINSQLMSYSGVIDNIEDKVPCPVCQGTRLRKEASYFRIDGKTITEVSRMEISDLYKWFCSLGNKLDGRAAAIAGDILKELLDRTRFLLDVGLDYLTLDRATASLSGGESQRIRLATQIGSRLVNVLYILDEPSIGLHQRDNIKLINSLKELRDQGNSVMVVEHDTQTMLESDWLVDIGPLSGVQGGQLCWNGPVEEALKAKGSGSITLDYLQGIRHIKVPPVRRKGNGKTLSLKGCRGNNLKNVDIDLPLGCFIGISGVSGSGKSSLISDTLMPILKNHFFHAKMHPLEYGSIEGLDHIDKVIEVDQSPIGRTPRSNPATFTDVFGDIRKLFEATPDAKIRGFKAGRFSFNVSGGRCEECKGAGLKVIQMNFLPSVNVKCPVCQGRRYKEDTLAVHYKGKNISDVLEMTISEASEFFSAIPSIATRLQALEKVGLGYVHLGQSAVTLSGGEAQRMKLAAELGKKDTGNTLYILDEPTTGLHEEDIKILLVALQSLVDEGNTVIVIEHNLDILKSTDYIFDLGPEGGKDGGRIVAQGTPEELSANPDSVTGIYLKKELEKNIRNECTERI